MKFQIREVLKKMKQDLKLIKNQEIHKGMNKVKALVSKMIRKTMTIKMIRMKTAKKIKVRITVVTMKMMQKKKVKRNMKKAITMVILTITIKIIMEMNKMQKKIKTIMKIMVRIITRMPIITMTTLTLFNRA